MKYKLGKTATSRTRKKKIIEVNNSSISNECFADYLFQKGYSSTTVRSFTRELHRFMQWMERDNTEIENIGYNDITAYLQSFGSVSQQTKRCYLRGVKHYFDYLIAQEQRSDNPAAFIQLKGIKRRTLYDVLNRQELDNLYHQYKLPDEQSKEKNQNWFKSKMLAQQRNKVIVGCMLYQGLDAKDIHRLQVSDVKLKEGLLHIPGSRKSEARELKLEALQIMELMEYMLHTRKALLAFTGKTTEQLFISVGTSEGVGNMMSRLIKRLHQINPKVSSIKQIKTSVIVHWLKLYNLRQVQYMAGHRYISSTENYLVNEMDSMIEDIAKYHPIG